MPLSTITISGDIEDFARIDNLYNSLKREGKKMLKNWKIDIDVKFTEQEGTEVPE